MGEEYEAPWGGLEQPVAVAARGSDGRSEVRRQPFFQPHRRPPHLGLHRPERHVLAHGDIPVAELVAAALHEYLAVAARVRGDRTIDGVTTVAVLIFIVRLVCER